MRVTIVLLMIACFSPHPAQAYFLYMPAAVLPPAKPVATLPTVHSALSPAHPVSLTSSASPSQNAGGYGLNPDTLLPKAVLTVLPYNWRYQIPDVAKRSLRVSRPKNIPWREAIRSMADEAGCEARFDENAHRVTLVTVTGAFRTGQVTPAPSTPVNPVSALHPASLPEPKSNAVAPPSVEVSSPSTAAKTTPPTIETALRKLTAVTSEVSTPAPATTPTSLSKPVPESTLPVISVKASPETVTPPATLIEFDGSNSVLAQDESESWAVEPGSLYAQMTRWTDRAGYQLVWKAQEDLTMQASATFAGSFADVTRQLFAGLARSGHSLRVTLYQSNNVMEVRGE